MRRSEQRREAVFGIYQHDVTGRALDASLPRGAHEFTRALAQATLEHRDELDAVIARHSRGWAIDRIAPLERAIMRVALLEMLHPGAVPAHEPIPAEGAIDEAVATAKDFCGTDAPGFVNGVLDAALRELRENQATTR
jgi:N utilization substance protein B